MSEDEDLRADGRALNGGGDTGGTSILTEPVGKYRQQWLGLVRKVLGRLSDLEWNFYWALSWKFTDRRTAETSATVETMAKELGTKPNVIAQMMVPLRKHGFIETKTASAPRQKAVYRLTAPAGLLPRQAAAPAPQQPKASGAPKGPPKPRKQVNIPRTVERYCAYLAAWPGDRAAIDARWQSDREKAARRAICDGDADKSETMLAALNARLDRCGPPPAKPRPDPFENEIPF